jgi:hypothetical protein
MRREEIRNLMLKIDLVKLEIWRGTVAYRLNRGLDSAHKISNSDH